MPVRWDGSLSGASVARLVLRPAAKATAAVWFSVAAALTVNSLEANIAPAQNELALGADQPGGPPPGIAALSRPGPDPLSPVVPVPPTEVVATVQPSSTSVDAGSLVTNGAPAPFGVSSVVALTGSGIPVRAYQAYQKAQALVARDLPACHLPWPLLAGIGRLESNHGRFGGAVIGPDGRVAPAIFGPLLDGHLPGTAVIHDSDHGLYDGSTTWDRAVGPMQFLPQSWRRSGADGNGDGLRDPQQIDDAAYAAALYLCTGGGDLSTFAAQYAAVYRYNHSDGYVRLVLSLAATYDSGRAVAVPDTVPEGGHAGDSDPAADAGGQPLGLTGDGAANPSAPTTTTPGELATASGSAPSTTSAGSTTSATADPTATTPSPTTTLASTTTTAAPSTTPTTPTPTTTSTTAPTTTSTTAPAPTTSAPVPTTAPTTTATTVPAPTTTAPTTTSAPATTARPTAGTALQTPVT